MPLPVEPEAKRDLHRYFVEEAFLVFQVLLAILGGLLLPKASLVGVLLIALAVVILIPLLPYAKQQVEAKFALDFETRAQRQQEELNLQLNQVLQERERLQERLRNEETGAALGFVQKRIMDDAVEALSDLLRDVVRQLKAANDEWENAYTCDDKGQMALLLAQGSSFVNHVSGKTLDKIRAILNHRDDVRGADPDIRVTLFRCIERGSRSTNSTTMRRYAWSYPPALFPKTEEFAFAQHAESAIFQCYIQEEMFILSNIPRAFESGHGWLDTRSGQHKEYGSTVCYPVITGAPRSKERRFIGVVTITSRQIGFFSDDPSASGPIASPMSSGFLARLLHPFALLLGMLTEYEQALALVENAVPPAARPGTLSPSEDKQASE